MAQFLPNVVDQRRTDSGDENAGFLLVKLAGDSLGVEYTKGLWTMKETIAKKNQTVSQGCDGMGLNWMGLDRLGWGGVGWGRVERDWIGRGGIGSVRVEWDGVGLDR